MLNFKTTLKQYRKAFETNPGYRLYCRSLLSANSERGGKGAIHFAMALLLGGPGMGTPIQKQYLNDVMGDASSKNSGNWTSAANNNFPQSIGITTDQLPDLYNLKETVSVGEVLQTLKEHTDYSDDKIASKIQLLEKVLAQLLIATEKELLIDLIREGECRQIILTGAPGTGKTFVAGQVAEAACAEKWGGMLKNERDREEPYTQVQFHPSYDYTDFMEGLRPVMTGGTKNNEIQFAKVDGTFKAFCRRVIAANEAYKQETLAKIQNAAEAFANTLSADTYAEQIKEVKKILPEAALEPLSTIKALLDTAAVCAEAGVLNASLPDADAVAHLAKTTNKLNYKNFPVELQADVQAVKDQAQKLATLLQDKDANGNDGQYLLILKAMNETIAALENYLKDSSESNLKSLNATVKDLFAEKLKDVRNATLSNGSGFDEEILAKWRQPNLAQSYGNWSAKVAQKHAKLMLDDLKQCHPVFRLQAFVAQLCTRKADYVTTAKRNADDLARTLAENPALIPIDSSSYPLYFFIVDEINRANLSKVFGELMYCLEKDKRGKKIPTQYQSLPTCNANGEELKDDVFVDGFCVPENVVIIGTMNDIDRSVDSMDFALRRRFEWREIVVSEYGLLNAFLSGHYGSVISENAYALTCCIRNLNRYLDYEGAEYDLNRQYHISQGQFANLPKRLSTKEDVLEYVWKYRIESLLREYLRGEPENKLEEFIGKPAPDRDYNAYTGACKALFSGLLTSAQVSDKDETLPPAE